MLQQVIRETQMANNCDDFIGCRFCIWVQNKCCCVLSHSYLEDNFTFLSVSFQINMYNTLTQYTTSINHFYTPSLYLRTSLLREKIIIQKRRLSIKLQHISIQMKSWKAEIQLTILGLILLSHIVHITL